MCPHQESSPLPQFFFLPFQSCPEEEGEMCKDIKLAQTLLSKMSQSACPSFSTLQAPYRQAGVFTLQSATYFLTGTPFLLHVPWPLVFSKGGVSSDES